MDLGKSTLHIVQFSILKNMRSPTRDILTSSASLDVRKSVVTSIRRIILNSTFNASIIYRKLQI